MGFKDDFRKQVEARLGKPIKQMRLATILAQLNLEKYRETIRRMLSNGGKEPSPQKQDEIKNAMGWTAWKQPHHPADGFDTRKAIRDFYQQGNPEFTVRGVPNVRPDIELLSTTGGFRLLLRCIEDDDNLDIAPDDYFYPHIFDVESLPADSVTLITHRQPSEAILEYVAKKNAPRVMILRVSEFLARYFDLASYQRKLEAQLSEAGLAAAQEACPVPARDLSTGHSFDDYYAQQLIPLLQADAPVTIALLGHFGTGKTCLCVRAAKDILDEARRSPSHWCVPIIIHAKELPPAGEILDTILFKVELAYGNRLPRSFIETLISTGKLIVFIDALDESPSLTEGYQKVAIFLDGLPQKGVGHAKYVVTARREMFPTAAAETEAFHIPDFHSVVLRPLNLEDARRALEMRIGAPKTERLLADPVLSQAVLDLITTPLFLSIVAEVTPTSTHWLELGRSSLEVGRSNRIVFQLFEQYARKWSRRETERESRDSDYEDRWGYRKAFCQCMAAISFDQTIRNDHIPESHLRPAVTQVYSILYDMPVAEASREFDRIFLECRLSMFLVRDDDTGDFRFAHMSMRSFFLATVVAEELLSNETAYDTLSRAPIKREMSLLPVFVFGTLWGGDTEPWSHVERVLRVVRGHRTSLQTASAPVCFLTRNLVFLSTHLQLLTRERAECSLEGLALPFTDLDQFVRVGQTSVGTSVEFAVDNANLEYARHTRHTRHTRKGRSGDPLVLTELREGEYLGPITLAEDKLEGASVQERKDRIRQLREYCWRNNILVRGDGLDLDPDQSSGFEWIAVPGGVWNVQNFVGREIETDVAGANAVIRTTPSGQRRVVMPSFLIQRHPVTNLQFLRFVQSNPAWLPEVHRRRIDNEWYLKGWNKLKVRADEGDPKDLDEVWRNSPVVFVDWLAASAFARFHSCCLPSEVEFEISARMYQEDFGDLPWSDVHCSSVEGYALYDTGEAASVIPRLDCTSTVGIEGIARFAEWAGEHDNYVPLHLIGLVQEWMADAWHPNWPVGINEINDGDLLAPVNEGFEGEPGSYQRVLPVKTRSLRGGSILTPEANCRISFRHGIRVTAENMDGGFRCVRRIVPA